jgi:hypothetical protein
MKQKLTRLKGEIDTQQLEILLSFSEIDRQTRI